MSDPQIERAAQVLFPLLYEHAPETRITKADQNGPFAKPIKLLLDHHKTCVELSAKTGELYDVWSDCQSIWEGLRANDDGSKQYGLLDQEIRRIAIALDNGKTVPLAPALPKSTNGNRSIELVVDWRQQGITLRDLQHKEFQAERWLIENIFPEGALLLAAKYKSKKSWIALALSLAVSMGGKALGQLDVSPGRVLYLDLEGKQQRIQKRTRAILGVRQVEWPENFHVFTKWPRGDEAMRELENWFASYPDTALVIVDVLASFRRPMEKHEMMYQYDRDTVDPINEMGERNKAGILLVHHFNKGKGYDDIMDAITGSTGLPSAVNTMWGLARDPNDSKITILHLRGRDLENEEPLALKWDDYLNMHVLEGPAREVSISSERKTIMAVLADDEPRTPKEIAAEVGRPVDSVKQLLRKLLSDELIDKPVYGKYARIPTKRDHSDHSDHDSHSDHSDHSVAKDVHTTSDTSDTAQVLQQSDRSVQRVIPPDHSVYGHQEASNDKSDRSDRDQRVSIFDRLPQGVAFTLRNYFARSDYEDRAKVLCAKHGIDYEQAKREVSG